MSDYENAPLEAPIMEDDGEFGAPEDVKIDINRQINHLMQSFSNDNMNLHWKVSQHAAEIDALKIALAEKESEVEALSQALQSEREYAENIEGQWQTRLASRDALLERAGVYLPDIDTDPAQAERALNLAGDPQPAVDEFQALASGQPGLGGGGR